MIAHASFSCGVYDTMTNDDIARTAADGGAASPTGDVAACRACQAWTHVSAAPPVTGALLWLCPLCGRAWPLFAQGDRGAMARRSSDRINRIHHHSPTP